MSESGGDGLFSLSASDSDGSSRASSPDVKRSAASSVPTSAEPTKGANSTTRAQAEQLLKDMMDSDTSSGSDVSSDDDDLSKPSKQKANLRVGLTSKPPPITTTLKTETTAIPAEPTPAPSAFKFKLSLNRGSATDPPPASAATSSSPAAADVVRPKRAPKASAESQIEPEAPAKGKKRGRPPAAEGAAHKKQKSGRSVALAAEPLPAESPVIVIDRYQWLQCDDCGKWRKLKEGVFSKSDLTFSDATIASLQPSQSQKNKPHSHHSGPAMLPLPSFVSLHPLSFEDLRKGAFFCCMNPNLDYARCSAEEETAENEITLAE